MLSLRMNVDMRCFLLGMQIVDRHDDVVLYSALECDAARALITRHLKYFSERVS